MEAALVSAATGALKPVLGKLGALLGDEYKRFKGVREDIKSLTHELASMDAFLMEMSEEEDPGVQDKVWMNEVRELSYKMEDTIDDFVQRIDDKDTKPDSFIEKIRHSLGKMKARRRIGKEIQGLKKDIIEAGDKSARYKGRVIVRDRHGSCRTGMAASQNSAVDPRALAIFKDASELVGIDEPKAEIIEMLTQWDVNLVSIVGFGGMGKTTLANQVYQDLKTQFNCCAFVSVSQNPDMMNILRTILSEVSGRGYARTEAGSIQLLIHEIREFLANKRYFIVIDDIWDVDTWDVIEHVFPSNNHNGRVITTTRKSEVAKACHSSFSGNIYDIRPLNMEHSWQLFCRRLLYSGEYFPSHLEKVSDEILRKCDGLPLAIITISGLLASKEKTEDLWNQVKDTIGRALERDDSGVKRMMKILSLSYFDLPYYLRSCLLYMSIFPEDSIVERKVLIRRWIYEGLIQKRDVYTVYEIGERCFNELLNRSLIQPVETNEDDSVKTFRVHDIILDFIISKSTEENFVTIVGVPILTSRTRNNVVHRLSVQGDSTIPTTSTDLSHVRSLHVFRDAVQIPSLEEFKHLRLLHLKHYRRLEKHHLENMLRLFQLRYLNLKNTGISELPEQIGRLGCLEMLDLRQTVIQELPASLVNLGKLSYLFVGSQVKLPDGIAKMQALEMLKKIMVFNQSFEFPLSLGQLSNLTKLALDLHLEVKYVTQDINVVPEEWEKDIVSSLCKLGTQNLHSLIIWNGTNLLQRPWCPIPQTLEKLITRRSTVVQVPKWLSSLKNLQHLRLVVEGVKQEDLCILGALPSLLFLHLSNESCRKERLIISGEVGFRCLRIFNYYAGGGPSDLMFGAGSMPNLENLAFSVSVDEGDSQEFGINNLPRLITFESNVHMIRIPSPRIKRLASSTAHAIGHGNRPV